MDRARLGRTLLLGLAVAFALLRFVDLSADPPRNIRWDDGIATDEGWYASAAINQHAWGMPLLPGDMNIPVLMPVWSLVARAAFALGGFGVVPLRAAAAVSFFICLLLCCVLLRRFGAGKWVPLFALMLAANPWAFAFSRSSFLEFPMLALCLLATALVARGKSSVKAPNGPLSFTRVALAGVVLGLALLLKTTAVVLLPVPLYVLLREQGFDLRRSARGTIALFTGIVLLYAPYWFFCIRTHQVDVDFYLSVVPNTLRLTPYGLLADASRPFRYGLGSDHLMFAGGLVVIAWSLAFRKGRALWSDPLFALAAVWTVSFLAFMVKHNNDPARYFAVIIPALLLLAVALLRNEQWRSSRLRTVFLCLLALDVTINAAQVCYAMLHPKYSFRDASRAIAGVVQRNPAAETVVIGDNMEEVALQSGLKPVNLLFHSASITDEMKRYQPGWWLQFSPIEDGRCYREVLSQAYTAEQQGAWTVFYPGQQLILWKLTKRPGASLPKVLTAAQAAACKPPVYN